MIMSNIPSSSGTTQTTVTTHNQFSSFSNQPSSQINHQPSCSPTLILPNLLPYNPAYFLPVQQHVLPPTHPQAYLTTRAYPDSEFPYPPPPNPVQQYSVLLSHTNTPVLYQNPSFSYEQHPVPSLTDGSPPSQHSGLDCNFEPFPQNNRSTSAAVSLQVSPLMPATVTTIVGSHRDQFTNLTATSQKVSIKSSHSRPTPREHSLYQHSPLSHHPTPSCTPSPLPTTAAVHSSAPPATTSSATTPPAAAPSDATFSATTLSAVTASMHQHTLSPAMQRYVSFLKNFFEKKKTPVYDKESSLLHFKCNSFVNIALVHKDSGVYRTDSEKSEMLMDRLHGHVDVIQKKKTKLPMCDVCKCEDGRPAQCVLVEGAPGVGKTTFAFELCKRWAKEELLQEWPVVVIIKLRDHRTRTAQNLYELLYHPDPEIQQAVADLSRQDGKGMLIILDGYDELTDNQRDFNSVIQCLMSRELLCQSTLMVTSRPLATRSLHDNFVQSIDQHIEVLGFTEKNIEEYIQSACGDKLELVEDLKSYLSCHPFSSALMFNPLQCAIVTDLYRSHWESGDKGFAPKTLTELYNGLVHIMLLRYLTQHPVYKNGNWRIKDLSDLPEEMSQQLKSVTELAAEGIRTRQYVFDEFDRSIPSETLGLMQKEEVVASGSGISTSHNFLHLTLQEYLAAVNYSQQCSSPEQLTQLLTRDDLFPLNNFLQYYGMKHHVCRIRRRRKSTVLSSATHWPVVLFVAGRTKLSGVSTNIFNTGFHDSYHDDNITTVNVSLLHLLYETQSPQLIQSTLVTSRKYLSVSGSSALDWFVIGYCIANSTSTWRVEKEGNDSPKYSELVMGLCLGPKECIGECKIGSLHISGVRQTGKLKILSQLQPYAKSLTEMKLGCCEQREQRDLEGSKTKLVYEEVRLACYPMLKNFTISNVDSSFSASLLSFVSQHSNNLHMLSLNQCNLSTIATSSLIHFLQSPNNRLHQLTLDDCTIQIPDHTSSEPAAISYQLQMELNLSTATGSFSLEIFGSVYAINYIVSQHRNCMFYTNTLTILKVAIICGTTDLLHIDASLYSELEKLDIIPAEENENLLHVSVLVSSQQNNLRLLSMKRCNLTCDTVRSLIHSLQSSHCGLQELTLDDCISDHTHTTTTSSKLKLKSLDSGNVSLEFTGYCCDISHWLSQLSSYTQLTELILYLKRQDSTTTGTLQEIVLYPHALESLKIDSNDLNNLPLFILHFISLIQNHLHTLSLRRINLSSDDTRSLIHSLQSPYCRLHKLTMDDCTISTPNETQQNTISTKNNTTLCSLVTTDSLCVLDHMLSNIFFTQMTELCLCITKHDSSEAEVLTKIPVSCPVLETIKIDSGVSLSIPQIIGSWKIKSGVSLSLSISQFIESQQNNLHTMSLWCCNLSSDVTWSLILSLQSPHCKLHKLALCYCIIPSTNHTQLTTAIVSNTTITQLLFFNKEIDTSSLTALASGLKHNTTIEQLAVDKSSKNFTEDQFRVFTDAVGSSAVKKLWLYDCINYERWFKDCTLSNNNVSIEWYCGDYHLFNKW